jgi:hypothetical protein
MAFPLLKLMDLTGPLQFPDKVNILVFLPNGDRFLRTSVHLQPNSELERNLFVFDDQMFAGFTSDTQIHIGLTGPANEALGDQIIEATDINNPNEKFLDIPVNGVPGSIGYTLGYRVLSG